MFNSTVTSAGVALNLSTFGKTRAILFIGHFLFFCYYSDALALSMVLNSYCLGDENTIGIGIEGH